MSLCPNTVASSGKPIDLYFPLVENLPPAQVLSQAGNTVSLSGGGGSVNVASTTSVASSAQKLTAVTYDTGLLETNVAGVLNVGLGSIIGSTRIEGGNVVIQRNDDLPALEFATGVNQAAIAYDGTKILMGSDLDMSGFNVINTGGIQNVGPFNAISIRATDANVAIEAGTDLTLNADGNIQATSATGEIALSAKATKSILTLSDNGSGEGSVYAQATGATAASSIAINPADARMTGDGLVQLESTTGAGVSLVSATDITMNVGNAAGRINLNGGTALITNVPPIGITGNYLLLTINNTTYKIALVT